jgi:DNA-binding GntR family transcriptional regulator
VQLTAGGKASSYKELLDESQDSHRAILDAVLEGKAAKAETAARRHIARTIGMVDRFDEWRRVIAEAATHEHDDDPPPDPPQKRRTRKPAAG